RSPAFRCREADLFLILLCELPHVHKDTMIVQASGPAAVPVSGVSRTLAMTYPNRTRLTPMRSKCLSRRCCCRPTRPSTFFVANITRPHYSFHPANLPGATGGRADITGDVYAASSISFLGA
ncbi:MAG TPA: hypothetical protein PLG17_03850, partial [Thermodesulfobacteriota bacterium]|nr:hypothetical protein [Thermodesulfobacteriota bacterium]